MAASKLARQLDSLTRRSPRQGHLTVLVHSDRHDLHLKRGSIDPDRPFHGASLGKLCTAVVVGQLADESRLGLDSSVASLLPDDDLTGLFTPGQEPTVGDLLAHTSGIADYAEDAPVSGSPLLERALRSPSRLWSPQELVDFTREHLRPAGPRGAFHYSDTGYVLLGKIVERLTGQEFGSVLAERIFQPLGLAHTHFPNGGEHRGELAPAWLRGHEVAKTNVLTLDWAGGGVVWTLDDLLTFQRALWAGQLVSDSFRRHMGDARHRLRPGIHYGMGMMELRFEEFLFLLRGHPRLLGHTGILGTFAFHDPVSDVHYLLNMGSDRRIPAGVRTLIKLVGLVRKELGH